MEGFLENFESFIGVNFWTALFTLLNFLILFFVADRKSTRLNSSHSS